MKPFHVLLIVPMLLISCFSFGVISYYQYTNQQIIPQFIRNIPQQSSYYQDGNVQSNYRDYSRDDEYQNERQLQNRNYRQHEQHDRHYNNMNNNNYRNTHQYQRDNMRSNIQSTQAERRFEFQGDDFWSRRRALEQSQEHKADVKRRLRRRLTDTFFPRIDQQSHQQQQEANSQQQQQQQVLHQQQSSQHSGDNLMRYNERNNYNDNNYNNINRYDNNNNNNHRDRNSRRYSSYSRDNNDSYPDYYSNEPYDHHNDYDPYH